MSPRSIQRKGAGEADSRASASVLLNGLHVLEAFSVQEPVLGVTEISRKVDLHKSTVSRILGTLEQAGYVERDAVSSRFRLGLGLMALAGPLLADLDVRRAAGQALSALADRTRETAALMVWNGHESVVVEQVSSPQQVKHTAAIGTRYDTLASSSVRVFLADMTTHEVERLLVRDELAGVAEHEETLAQLAAVRDQGYAVNDGSTSVEEVGISAPVRDHRGAVAASVLLSAPRFRTPASRIQELTPHVVAAAHDVSARLGGQSAP